MKKLLCGVLLGMSLYTSAQLNIGGKPLGYQGNYQYLPTYSIKASQVDVQALLQEDQERLQDGFKDLRFGKLLYANLNLLELGNWETFGNERICRYLISAENAHSINLNFSKYQVPEGARLYCYNPETGESIGAFTNANHNPDWNFATVPLKGSQLVLEYHEPLNASVTGTIELESVVYAYRNIFNMAKDRIKNDLDAQDASCIPYINCPSGAGYQDIKRSVICLLANGNSAFCSATLVNNTAQDGKAYVLTANHCSVATNTIFAFNYETPACAETTVNFNNVVQGCAIRAN